jgi:hypothetical protein
MKNLVLALLVVFAAGAAPDARAHGAQARHGGVVQTANDLSFELVARPDGAVIYVEDHGKPVATAGMSGKLTVLNGAEKSEAAITPAGDRLEAKGVKVVKGSKVVAALSTADRKAITVRFTAK